MAEEQQNTQENQGMQNPSRKNKKVKPVRANEKPEENESLEAQKEGREEINPSRLDKDEVDLDKNKISKEGSDNNQTGMKDVPKH